MTHTQTLPSDDVSPREATTNRPHRARAIGLIFIGILAVGMAAFSVILYGNNSLETLAEANAGLGRHYATMPQGIIIVLYSHIITASAAIVLGVVQFIRPLRRRAPRVHRIVGRSYAVAVLLSSVSGLVLACVSAAKFVGFFGFGTLAVLWAWTMLRAWGAIRRRDVASHEAWMIRNYALTLAAPTLRIWLPLMIISQLMIFGETDPAAAFANAYAAVPFLAWLPNLIFAEWLVRRRGLPSYRITR